MKGLRIVPHRRKAPWRSNLRASKLVSPMLLALGLALGSTGCAKAPQKPPEAPLKQAKKDSRLDQEEEQDIQRRHLAPPPAYGNKVVMAQEENGATHQF